MQCFTGQETVMNSLQNSIRTVLVGFRTGQQITDLLNTVRCLARLQIF